MVNNANLASTLTRLGFIQDHATTKVVCYKSGTTFLYLQRTSVSHPIVIHGKHANRVAALCHLDGVSRAKPDHKPYHNANMRAFDLRLNNGSKPTRFGFDFDIVDGAALKRLVETL